MAVAELGGAGGASEDAPCRAELLESLELVVELANPAEVAADELVTDIFVVRG